MTDEEYTACEQELATKRFWAGIQAAWERDGIHDKTYLKYDFNDDDGGNKSVSTVCRKYAEHWEKMQENGLGMLLYGQVGAGKTFLLSCIGNAVLQQKVMICATSFPRILNSLQSSTDKTALLDRLALYQLVLLDDLGAERESSYVLEQVFSIVDSRYRSGKPLIVTTNITPKEMENPENMSYCRLYDRILEMCPIRVHVPGDSRRKTKTEHRKQLARELLL